LIQERRGTAVEKKKGRGGEGSPKGRHPSSTPEPKEEGWVDACPRKIRPYLQKKHDFGDADKRGKRGGRGRLEEKKRSSCRRRIKPMTRENAKEKPTWGSRKKEKKSSGEKKVRTREKRRQIKKSRTLFSSGGRTKGQDWRKKPAFYRACKKGLSPPATEGGSPSIEGGKAANGTIRKDSSATRRRGVGEINSVDQKGGERKFGSENVEAKSGKENGEITTSVQSSISLADAKRRTGGGGGGSENKSAIKFHLARKDRPLEPRAKRKKRTFSLRRLSTKKARNETRTRKKGRESLAEKEPCDEAS